MIICIKTLTAIWSRSLVNSRAIFQMIYSISQCPIDMNGIHWEYTNTINRNISGDEKLAVKYLKIISSPK